MGWGGDGSCCSFWIVDHGWMVWQTWLSHVTVLQVPRTPVPAVTVSANCSQPGCAILGCWEVSIALFMNTGGIYQRSQQAGFFGCVFSPNSHRDCSVHVLPLNPHDFGQLRDICTWVGESDSKRQNNFFENLEGSQGCTRA